jgi:hypothetical protein
MVAKNDSDWNGPQSSENLGREKLRKDSSGLGYPKPVDIEDRVNRAQEIHKDGFSARLPKSK